MGLFDVSLNPLGYSGSDLTDQPPLIKAQRAPTTNDIYPIGTQWADESVSPKVIYETVGNGVWQVGNNAAASTTVAGIVRLATVAETLTGTSQTIATTPAGVAAVAIAGAPDATTASKGITRLATNAEAVAGSALTPLAVTPANLASVFAAAPAIGGTTPAAGAFTTLAASGLATLSGSATITTGATALNLASDASTGAVNIGTGAGARAITIGNVTTTTGVTVNTGTGHFTVNTTSTGDIILNSADTMLLDSVGVLELNSSAGIISIGNDAVAQNINVGTGAAARVITIGNSSGATQVVVDGGSAGVSVGANAVAQTVTIGNQTGASAVTIDSGTGAINIGTAIAKTITIGNVTTSTAVAINSGTGGIALASTSTGDITLASSDTLLLDSAGVLELNSSAGVISIGNDAVSQNINVGTAGTRAIAIGNSTATTSVSLNGGTGSSVNVGTNAIAHTVTIGNIIGATAVAVNTGTGGFALNTTSTGTIVLNSTDLMTLDSVGVLELNSSAGVISIGNDAVAQNINIGTGAAARVITIGNVSSTTGIVLNSGTGNIALNTTTTGDVIVNSADTVLIDSAGVLELNSSAGAISIGNDAVAQAINIGTGAAARTISIGTGAAVVETIAIGGTGANVITIANTQTGGSLAIGAAMTTGTISIGGTGLQTGTITLGGGTGAQIVNVATGGTGVKTVHIADSAVANIVTLGSTTGAAATTIQAGTGLITMAGKVALNSSSGPQVLAGAGDPGGVVTAPQGSLWLRTDGSSTSTRAYINTNAGTAWTAVTTAS